MNLSIRIGRFSRTADWPCSQLFKLEAGVSAGAHSVTACVHISSRSSAGSSKRRHRAVDLAVFGALGCLGGCRRLSFRPALLPFLLTWPKVRFPRVRVSMSAVACCPRAALRGRCGYQDREAGHGGAGRPQTAFAEQGEVVLTRTVRRK